MTYQPASNPLFATLREFAESSREPIFFIGHDVRRKRNEIHIATRDRAKTESEIRAALNATGVAAALRVVTFDLAQATSAPTLEDLMRPFGHLAGVFDPTAIVGRARVVTDAVATARKQLGRQVRGVFLDPQARILHVVVRSGTDFAQVSQTFLLAIDQATQATGSRFNRPPLSVQVGVDLPLRALVPVDRRSARLRPVVETAKGWKVALASVAAAIGVGGVVTVAAAQQSGPAVSGVNAKIDVRGGYAEFEAERVKGLSGFATGAITAPLGRQFGVQFDGAVGSADGDFYWGAGAHLFWRNPAQGLVGIYGQTGVVEKGQLYRLGVEGEAYFGNVTLGAHAGYQIGDDSRRVHIDDGVFAGAKLKYYVTDNFALSIGGGIEHTSGYGRAGFEFQPGFSALPGLSIFADAGIGTDHHSFAMAGIRYYFGDNKSLKRRHREDDPELAPLSETQKYERRGRGSATTPPYNPQ